MENLKIYLKDSDKAHLADIRARIVREIDPREPCENEDLVFEKAEDESLIPENALYRWRFDCNYEHEPIWFFTTAERCKKMVSEDPSYWTQEKLQRFAYEEKKLYQNWYDGYVYGYIIEKWDNAKRKWITVDSLWGMYSDKELISKLSDAIDDNVIVCADEETMKYEFDNVEMTPNEFD